MYNRLKENIKYLKLNRIDTLLDNYLERAVKENLSITECLTYLFEEERKSKADTALIISTQMAGFPFKKTFEHFDFDFQPSIDKKTIDDLRTMRFIENSENIVFLGPPGVGKTHLAISLGLEAIKNRFSVYYITCNDLISQLNKAHYENKLKDKLKIFAKYKLLIIDEVGYLPFDKQGANLFFQLISLKYEKTSIVITSNRGFSEWADVFSDHVVASAILDRILHHSTTVNIKGSSFRLKERKKAFSLSSSFKDAEQN